MANPVKCVGCWKPTFQVRLLRNNLREKTCPQVYDSLLNNNIAGLKHVAKKKYKILYFCTLKVIWPLRSFTTGSFIIDEVGVTVQPVRYSQCGLSFAQTSERQAQE